MVKAEYKPGLDILMVEHEEEGKFGRNLELGGFVLDLDRDENFLGLEIIDVSQKIGLDRDELEKVNEIDPDDLEVSLQKDGEAIIVRVKMTLGSTETVISSRYPESASA